MTPENSIKCSVCLSTRNKAEYLRHSLVSIFRQQIPFPYEVIVVDDGSTDHTEEVCKQFSVKYFYLDNPRYRNPSIARNVAFRAARGEIVLAQSDDIVHQQKNTIAQLVNDLQSGEFLLARTHNYVYRYGKPLTFKMEYCGPDWPKPYFFLGAISRADLCKAGGYDEEFVEPCFDDNWFADVLMKGLQLRLRITKKILAHHQSHGYEPGSHSKEGTSEKLYNSKVRKAKRAGVWANSGGSWDLTSVDPIVQPPDRAPLFLGYPTLNKEPTKPEGKIPRKMHFFWVGKRMSYLRYMTLYSFRHHHPDWCMIIHRMAESLASSKGWKSSEEQDHETYRGTDYFPRLDCIDVEVQLWTPPKKFPALAPSHACDFCQWEILAEEGGFYSDLDVIWVAPLTYNLVSQSDAVFCLTDAWMAIGLMASAGNSRLFREVLASCQSNYSPKQYQSTGAEAIYRLAGTWPNWGGIERVGVKALQILRKRYHLLKIIDVPQVTLYPWNYLSVDKIFEEVREVPGGCCGVHWFGGNTTAQKWNHLLTHENVNNYDSTIIRCIKEVIQ